MGKTYYRKITHNGKEEFVWDPNADYVRKNAKFIVDKTKEKEVRTKESREFNKIVKDHPYIKSRLKSIKNISKKIYYAKVWILTEGNDLTTLKNSSKRGFKRYHLDHIYPISAGFKNDIPPEVIGSIKNLQFIPARRNLKKRDTVTPESQKLMEAIKKSL